MGSRDKVVLIRVDFNSNIDNDKIADDSRIRAHIPTIEEYLDKAEKIILLTHQGRKGSSNFTSTKIHAEKLSELIDRTVDFIPKSEINNLNHYTENTESDLFLLENTRMFEDEIKNYNSPKEASENEFVTNLSSIADLFVNDAFSVGHRSHASVIGFPVLLESTLGPLFSSEISNLDLCIDEETVYCIGGSKIEDKIFYTNQILESSHDGLILTSGLVANVILDKCGKTEYKQYRINESTSWNVNMNLICSAVDDRLLVPSDVAVRNGGRKEIDIEELGGEEALDIGSKTISRYKDVIDDAASVMFVGPAGMYEEENFRNGTCEVLRSVSENENGVIAGGDTITASNICGFSDFSYVSKGGGAALEYASFGTLPAIQSIRENS